MSENSITIRKYKAEDKQDVVKVLFETSTLPIETESQRKYLMLLYNDYYTEQEPDSCFVVADSEDRAVGYIICAKNYSKYEKTFKKLYLPEIRKLGKSFWFQAKSEMLAHKLFKNKYPAHLHIDILPVCQGKGVGTKLMDALCLELKSRGVNGLMLSCGASNTRAIKFYEKNNFKRLTSLFGGYLMAKEL